MKKLLYFVAFLALCCIPGKSQTVTSLCSPICQFFDGSGNILSNGKIFSYQAGTTTLQPTYTDSTGATQNTNPIILNAAGMPSNINGAVGIFLTSAAYKFVAQNSLGIQVWAQDGITIFNPNNLSIFSSSNCTSNLLATAGFIRMCNGDLVNWRNIANSANIGFSQAGLAVAATGNVADILQYGDSGHGGFQAQRYLDFSTAPAQSGVLATGNNVCGVASRNAAGSGDVCALQVNAANITALGGTSGVTLPGPITAAFDTSGNSGLPAATSTNLWFAGNFGTPILGKIYIGDGSGWELDLAKRTGSTDTTLFKFFDSGSLTFGGETAAHLAHFFCSGFSTVIAATNTFQRCYADQAMTVIALTYNTNSTPGAGCGTQPTIDILAQGQTSQQLTMVNGSAFVDTTITPFNVNAGQSFALRVEVGPAGCGTAWTNVSASATVRMQ